MLSFLSSTLNRFRKHENYQYPVRNHNREYVFGFLSDCGDFLSNIGSTIVKGIDYLYMRLNYM